MNNNKITSKSTFKNLTPDKIRDIGWNAGMDKRVDTLNNLIAERIIMINGLVTRNGARGLINVFLEYVKAIRPRTTKSVVRQVASFIFYVGKLYKHNGMHGTVIYLKACQVLLQQSIAGYVVADLTELKVRPKRTKRGIPIIIPAQVRKLILRDRHIPSIKLWMTLFGLFRILEFVGFLKLGTITDAGVDLRKILPKFNEFLDTRFTPQLNRRVKIAPLQAPKLFPILKSGPLTFDGRSNSSLHSLILSARVWQNSGTLLVSLVEFCRQLNMLSFVEKLKAVSLAYHPLLDGFKIGQENELDQDNLLTNYFLLFPIWLIPILDVLELRITRKPVSYRQYEGQSFWELGDVIFLKLGIFNSTYVIPLTWMTYIIVFLNMLIKAYFGIYRLPFISAYYQDLYDKGLIRWSSNDLQKKVWTLRNEFSAFLLYDKNSLSNKGRSYLGKLSMKMEPAGKIRVFAMVDAWTQWIMWPLHKWIFSILKQLPDIDGTFNQLHPVLRLQRKYHEESMKLNNKSYIKFSSIDLSAATDRLPLSLQKSVIRSLLKDLVPDSALFAEAWGDLLTKRTYKIPNRMRSLGKNLPNGIEYSVGQPMGALSSWGMLALTHHAIVQFAAQRAGRIKWFEDYAILGDDIVIANGEIAGQYRQILELIGVKAGLAKSIIARSKFVVEFAKKFFVDTFQADMLPLKECIATKASTSLVVEFVRKYNLTLNSTLAFLGFGYKACSKAISCSLWDLSNRLRVLLVWLSHPNSPIGVGTKEDFNLYPYVSWLLQQRWLVPFSEVTHGNLCEINEILHTLLYKKMNLSESALERYEGSAVQFIREADENSPIYPNLVNTLDPEGLKPPKLYSWANLISKSELIDDKELGNLLSKVTATGLDIKYNLNTNHLALPTTPLALENHMRPSRDPFTRSVDVGIMPFSNPDLLINVNYDLVEQFVKSKEASYVYPTGDLLTNYDDTNPLIMLGIETMLRDLFTPSLHDSLIPQEFWAEERASERPFRDFLEIFKLWVMLSKRTWSEFYINKNKALPEKFLELQKEEKVKPKLKVKSTSLICIPDSQINTMIEVPWGIPYGYLKSSHRNYFSLIRKSIIQWIEILISRLELVAVKVLTYSLFTNMLSGENMCSTAEVMSMKNYYNTYSSKSIWILLIKLYKFSNWLVDVLVIFAMLIMIGNLYWSLEDALDEHYPKWPDNIQPSDSNMPSYKPLYYIIGTVVVLLMIYVASDMYFSYHTTLNYIDPAIKPLYLIPYAEIPEVIPSGLGRGDVIQIFEPSNLGPNTADMLLSPTSPMHMHGFWE